MIPQTAKAALGVGRSQLADLPEARADARILLQYATQRDAAWLLAHEDDVLEAAEIERYERALSRRSLGEPVAYITGESWFYGRRFEVSAHVLVPRSESEVLLEAVLDFISARGDVRYVCDVGTGSGILAISLACERPELELAALDRSPQALALARRNARANDAASRIAFYESDLFASVAVTQRFDCIVANLPYVRTADLATAPDPMSFEPRFALDGGDDGLEVYRRFLEQTPLRLGAGGGLFLEAGPDTAEGLAALAVHAIPGGTGRIVCDYAGRWRVVIVTT